MDIVEMVEREACNFSFIQLDIGVPAQCFHHCGLDNFTILVFEETYSHSSMKRKIVARTLQESPFFSRAWMTQHAMSAMYALIQGWETDYVEACQKLIKCLQPLYENPKRLEIQKQTIVSRIVVVLVQSIPNGDVVSNTVQCRSISYELDFSADFCLIQLSQQRWTVQTLQSGIPDCSVMTTVKTLQKGWPFQMKKLLYDRPTFTFFVSQQQYSALKVRNLV